ncbi:hypothetical protein KCU71_g6632, partial [Aureobasidium melanogenum]
MSDYNYRTKSWKDQAKLNTNDANEIARLLGAVNLRFQPGQQPGTFEPLNEDEPADEMPDNVQQQQPQDDDDEYGFVMSGTQLARLRLGQQALFDPEDDIEDDFDDKTHTTTYHNRLRTAPKLKARARARRLDTIQEEEEELDTDDELLATQPQRNNKLPSHVSITFEAREYRITRILAKKKRAGRPRLDGIVNYSYTVEKLGGGELVVTEKAFARQDAKDMLAKYDVRQ